VHPSTDLLFEFMVYLDDKALNHKIKQNRIKKSFSNTDGNDDYNNIIPWMETLWNIPLSDCRKRIIWLIFSRYVINKRRMSIDDGKDWIRRWLNRCNCIKSTLQAMMEYHNGQVAINPKLTKLITALRTAVENGEGVLDKDVTSHDDLFDAFRMSLMFWH
jgi:non-catalytic primase subunit PriX-like protein